MQEKLTPRGVAVCVTEQKNCDRLISAGRALADKLQAELVVMSAQPRLYNEETSQALEYLYTCSAQAGAEMLVMYTDKPFDALIEGFSKRGIGHVVLGEAKRRSLQMRERLMCGYPDADYYVISDKGQLYQQRASLSRAL